MHKKHALLAFFLINAIILSAQRVLFNAADLHWCDTIFPAGKAYLASKVSFNPAANDTVYFHNEKPIKIFGPKTTRWVKKKGDKNCLSLDPNDCLVWCLEEVPAITIEMPPRFHISSPYVYQIVPNEYILKKYYDEVVARILCEVDRPQVLKFVVNAMTSKNYLRKKEPDETQEKYQQYINENLEQAMEEYQLENGLSQVPWELPTLVALDIVFEKKK